jgi:hypothetical protein
MQTVEICHPPAFSLSDDIHHPILCNSTPLTIESSDIEIINLQVSRHKRNIMHNPYRTSVIFLHDTFPQGMLPFKPSAC